MVHFNHFSEQKMNGVDFRDPITNGYPKNFFIKVLILITKLKYFDSVHT